MSRNKPSFLLYKSFYEPIKNFTLEEKGLLFDAIFNFQNGILVENLSPQVAMAFAFFKNQFELDGFKYQQKCDKNAESIRLHWEKQKATRTNTNEYERIGTNRNATDIDKEKDKEKDKDIDKYMSDFENFWLAYRPIHTGKGNKEKAKALFFKALKKDSLRDIANGLNSYMQHCHDNNTYTKAVDGWLKNECWKNEYEGIKKAAKGKNEELRDVFQDFINENK